MNAIQIDNFTKCPLLVTLFDKTGDTSVLFKCATVFELWAVHAVGWSSLFHLASARSTCVHGNAVLSATKYYNSLCRLSGIGTFSSFEKNAPAS